MADNSLKSTTHNMNANKITENVDMDVALGVLDRFLFASPTAYLLIDIEKRDLLWMSQSAEKLFTAAKGSAQYI